MPIAPELGDDGDLFTGYSRYSYCLTDCGLDTIELRSVDQTVSATERVYDRVTQLIVVFFDSSFFFCCRG